MDALRQAADALERGMGCIRGLCRQTPVRDVTETLAEMQSAIDALAAPPQERIPLEPTAAMIEAVRHRWPFPSVYLIEAWGIMYDAAIERGSNEQR